MRAGLDKFTAIKGSLQKYVFERRWLVAALITLSLLTYGSSMFNYSLNIDEERSWMLYSTYREFAGLAIRDGRFGLVILAWLTMTTSAFPYWADILSVMFLIMFCLLIGYYFRNKNIPQFMLVIAFCLFITYPSHSYMLAFSYMMPSISLCYSLNLFASLLMNEWVNVRRFSIGKFSSTVLLLTISIATYQSMAMCFLLTMIIINLDNMSSKRSSYIFQIFAKCLIVMAASYGLYKLINAVLGNFYLTRSIIDPRMRWGTDSIVSTAMNVLRFIYHTLIGGSVYGGVAIGISFLSSVGFSVYRVVKRKRLDCLDFMPFIMTTIALAMSIGLGNSLPSRTMQTIPLLIIGLCVHMAIVLKQLKPVTHCKPVAAAICIALLLVQVHSVNRLTYTQIYRYERERELVSKISLRIEEITQDRRWEKPIVFLGQYPIYANNKQMIVAETISGTAFNWDTEEYQVRKHLYFSFLGYPYPLPDQTIIQHAQVRGESMPIWPHKDSTQEFEDFIIVKLGT